MSKPIKRQCPACQKTREFRADQKTCGCQGSNPNLASVAIPRHMDERVKKMLLGKKLPLTEVANKLDVAPKVVEEAVGRLADAGHNVRLADNEVSIDKALEPGGQLVVDSKDFTGKGKWFKLGAMGDTHLYSKYCRLDVAEALYDIYADEGIETVYHAGNMIEGEARFNKFDLVGPSGMGRQVEYNAKHYPRRDGITTKFITGDDHEGWYINREGVNVGRLLESAAEDEGRKDLRWIGHVEADVKFKSPKGEAWMRVSHPGGGSAYATSYTEQKLVESYQGGEKPHIQLVGHYHKLSHGYPREVHTVQTGCTQDQTPFLRKLKIQAHVGGTIIRFHQADTGEINRFQVEFITFFDKKFYEKLDKYRRW
jgi:hypothetical protein